MYLTVNGRRISTAELIYTTYEYGVFNEAVARYHSPVSPWHHAMHDAYANRAGWMSAMNELSMGQKKDPVQFMPEASTTPVLKHKYSLEELLAQRPDNFPTLTEEEKAWLDAPPVGKEIL